MRMDMHIDMHIDVRNYAYNNTDTCVDPGAGDTAGCVAARHQDAVGDTLEANDALRVLHGRAAVRCSGMVQRYGAAVWCCGMVQRYGAAVRCCGMMLRCWGMVLRYDTVVLGYGAGVQCWVMGTAAGVWQWEVTVNGNLPFQRWRRRRC